MTHIEQRNGTAADWTAQNPVMHYGELGWEADTLKGKLGDGVTAWNALPYLNGVSSVAGKTGVVSLVVADVAGAAPLLSPALTGDPTAPTPAMADNDTSIATTAFVKNQGYGTAASVALKAPLASPALTGTPTAPTQAVGANGTSIATTAFVKNQGYATTVSPALTGTPLAPTQAVTDSSTRIATTAFVRNQFTPVVFTPTFISGITSVGNGSVLGRYTLKGKELHLWISIVIGTTAVTTAAQIVIALPGTMATDTPAGHTQSLLLRLYNSVSGGAQVAGFASSSTGYGTTRMGLVLDGGSAITGTSLGVNSNFDINGAFLIV